MCIKTTGYGLDGPEFGYRQWKIFLYSKTSRPISGAHTASYSMGTGVNCRAKSGQAVRLPIHLHVVSRRRVSGAMLLLILHAFMVWRGTILLLLFNNTCRFLSVTSDTRNKSGEYKRVMACDKAETLCTTVVVVDIFSRLQMLYQLHKLQVCNVNVIAKWSWVRTGHVAAIACFNSRAWERQRITCQKSQSLIRDSNCVAYKSDYRTLPIYRCAWSDN